MTGGSLTSISKVVDKSEVSKLEAIVTAFKSFEENRVEKLEKACDTTANKSEGIVFSAAGGMLINLPSQSIKPVWYPSAVECR